MENFDVIAYFEDRGIEYHTHGKNVTKGWVNIQCPFDTCFDPSWHCGINLESKCFNCWVCGQKGSIRKLIRKLEKCSWFKVDLIIQQFQNIDFQFEQPKKNRKIFAKKIIFPKTFSYSFPEKFIRYLEKRGFDAKKIIKKYRLMSGNIIGKYKFRIIVPVIMNNKIVNFVARDITEKAESKYLSLSNEKAILPIKQCLYNIDTVKDKVIITEGVTDVWRIGDSCIATFGKEITDSQIRILIEKNIKKIYFVPDKDSINYWIKLAKKIAIIFDHVEVIKIDREDPALLNNNELKLLKEILHS